MFSKIFALTLIFAALTCIVAQPAPLKTSVPADAVGVVSWNSTEARDLELEKRDNFVPLMLCKNAGFGDCKTVSVLVNTYHYIPNVFGDGWNDVVSSAKGHVIGLCQLYVDFPVATTSVCVDFLGWRQVPHDNQYSMVYCWWDSRAAPTC